MVVFYFGWKKVNPAGKWTCPVLWSAHLRENHPSGVKGSHHGSASSLFLCSGSRLIVQNRNWIWKEFTKQSIPASGHLRIFSLFSKVGVGLHIPLPIYWADFLSKLNFCQFHKQKHRDVNSLFTVRFKWIGFSIKKTTWFCHFLSQDSYLLVNKNFKSPYIHENI